MKKQLLIIGAIILTLVTPFVVVAITEAPTDYSNNITGRLKAPLTISKTTGITITADTIKTPAGQAAVTFPTGKMILKISRQAGNITWIEYIAAESATQAGATVTLGKVTRYLSSSDGSDFTSHGNGLAFPTGSIVELTWGVHQAEGVVYKGSQNVMTGTGSITGSASTLRQANIILPSFTTAQESALTPLEGSIIRNSTLGSFRGYNGGAWGDLGGGGTNNAGFANSGKVELATPAEVTAQTASGSSGAPLVVPVKDIITVTTGSADAGKVVATISSGLIDSSLLPSSVYGNGSNGSLTATGKTVIDCLGVALCERNYTSLSIPTGATLSVINGSDSGTVLRLKVTGNFTLSGTLNLTGSGSIGGARINNGSIAYYPGNNGGRIFNGITTREFGYGGGDNNANHKNGGGGGGNVTSGGWRGTGETTTVYGGTGGVFYLSGSLLADLLMAPGAGGGSGGVYIYDAGDANTHSGAGGRGGGSLYASVGGNFSFYGTIKLNGNNAGAVGGADTNYAYESGGGGGAAGIGLIKVAGTIIDMGTKTATGGSGTTGDAGYGIGGKGASGNIVIQSAF